jgi:hypothetical protein
MRANAKNNWNENREPAARIELATNGLQICCRLFVSVHLGCIVAYLLARKWRSVRPCSSMSVGVGVRNGVKRE